MFTDDCAICVTWARPSGGPGALRGRSGPHLLPGFRSAPDGPAGASVRRVRTRAGRGLLKTVRRLSTFGTDFSKPDIGTCSVTVGNGTLISSKSTSAIDQERTLASCARFTFR